MLSFIRHLFSTEEKEKTEMKILTNFEMFQASQKFPQFQQEYPGIDFIQPVEIDQLVKDEQYLMVYLIHCWDDFCNKDHECRLDFGMDRVVFMGLNNNNYEFLEDPEDFNTIIRINNSVYSRNENTSHFFYSLNHTHFIK